MGEDLQPQPLRDCSGGLSGFSSGITQNLQGLRVMLDSRSHRNIS
jgi:hypothetical protein